MKILYSKFNSERNPKFQLKTIVFEKDGKKFVKKEALTKEAKEHIANMINNYKKLSNAITNPNLKVVPIVESSDRSITFEFINGQSLEDKFFKAFKESKEGALKVIDEFKELINNSFKTTTFDANSNKERLTELFGFRRFEELNGLKAFDEVSNIDLIFSNIIYSGEDIYLIDYEWSFDISLPIEYIIHRSLNMQNLIELEDNKYDTIFTEMERHFIDKVVMKDGFYFYKYNYIKTNVPITKHIEVKEKHIDELAVKIKNYHNEIITLRKEIAPLHKKLDSIGRELTYARAVVEYKDQLLEAARIKSRVKKAIKKILPSPIASLFGDKLNVIEPKEPSNAILKTGYSYTPPQINQNIIDEINNFNKKPLFSIIMPVYNVDPKWLDLAIKSIEAQWYENWELCIADDKSTNEATINYLKSLNNPKIKIKFLEKNLNISGASNKALELASGDYIVLMDNDDEITPDALYEVAKKINESDADFIYSDEDFVDTEGNYSNPHFKPDFSPDLLLSHNYITHLSAFKRSLLEKVGNFRDEFSGSQDYDLFLRITEVTNKIEHIPKVLYHWRTLESSTSANAGAKPEAIERSKRVLEDALKRRGIKAIVEYGNIPHYFRVKYEILDNPLVSIVIPFKDKPELLDMCINSILNKSTYQNFEIIGISNNSQEEATFEMMKSLEAKDTRVKFYEYNVEFNYAQINNHAVENYAKGEHILLLNNDIEVIEPTWIEAMLEHSQRKEIGCVGAKLYYPNDKIQHAGIIMGLGGYAGHSHKMYDRDSYGYFNRLNAIQNVSAVTAACLMVKKSIYQEVNGMDEVKFKVAYNDVDFCLRVREKGYLNLFTPYAELYHHESISRGYETTPEKIARFQTEKDALYERHKEILENGDPYYNPNLTHSKEDFSLCLE